MVVPWMFLAFVGAVVFFHLSELAFVLFFQRERLSFESALLSPPYVAMMALASVEFWLEWYWLPGMKHQGVAIAGLMMVICGETIRKAGMLTARTGFTHTIAQQRLAAHRLTTHGIYRYVRHPGYLGWFIWAVGAQLLLVNPLTTVLSIVTAWSFFAKRIPHEEALLRQFFPDTYEAYRKRTRTWLPLIP